MRTFGTSGQTAEVSPLPRSFYARPAEIVAPDLLNKVVMLGELRGRIVETEAYGGSDDPASHGFRRKTDRNAVMFGRAGLLYVYFTYGMHYCVCVVTGDEGVSSAVLIRAVEPLGGLPVMRRRRPKARTDVDLTNGPAKFAQAFALTTDHDGLDVCALRQVDGDSLVVADDGIAPPPRPTITTRVGLSKGVETRWRWFVAGNRAVSKGRPSSG